MDLTLSDSNVRNTTFCNAEGQVLYRSETPSSLSPRTTTITKVVPNTSPEDMVDRYTELASIEWATVASSLLTYGGYEISTKEFIPSSGILAQYRTFTANDMKSYRWTLGTRISSLVLNDGSKTPVAKMHRHSMGILGKPRKARLEIFSGFEGLMDDIVVTFIYVEKLRKARERAAESAHM